MGSAVLSVQSAREVVLQQCRTLVARSAVETVPLLDSFQRVLAESVTLDRDQPPFDRSMRDGFAVRAEDVRSAPVTLLCAAEVKAGETTERTLQPGETFQIMTGAAVPQGTDSVVMVEHTERMSGGEVRFLRTSRPGENVAPKGSEGRAGDAVLQPGRRISALEAAVLAATGRAHVRVFRRPLVAILATGDELVEIESVPRSGQIRNSNSFSLVGQVLRCGAVPLNLGIARDNLPDLRRQVRQGLESDVLLVSGGVSMGKYDLVEPVFEELGVMVHFEAVSMRPGKPTVFGTWNDRCVFGLPGNPLSTFVAFELFVRPVLRVLQGLSSADLPIVTGRLQSDVVERSGRSAFLPALAVSRLGNLEITPLNSKGSADLFGAVESNALLIVPMEAARLNCGELAQALLFGELGCEMDARL